MKNCGWNHTYDSCLTPHRWHVLYIMLVRFLVSTKPMLLCTTMTFSYSLTCQHVYDFWDSNAILRALIALLSCNQHTLFIKVHHVLAVPVHAVNVLWMCGSLLTLMLRQSDWSKALFSEFLSALSGLDSARGYRSEICERTRLVQSRSRPQMESLIRAALHWLWMCLA